MAGTGSPVRTMSMLPETFVQGGLWDDLDVELVDVAWVRFNFAKQGERGAGGELRRDEPQKIRLSLGTEWLPLTGLEANEKPYQQQFSAGDLKFFVPSDGDGGAYAVPVGSHAAMNLNTNSAEFLMSLFEVATPEQRAWLNAALATGNCKNLLSPDGDRTCGLQVHLKRFPQKERKGLSQEESKDRSNDILKVTTIIALPGQVASAVGPKGRYWDQVAANPAPVIARPGTAAPIPAVPQVAAPQVAASAPVAPTSTAAAGGKANGAAKSPAARVAAPPPPPGGATWGEAELRKAGQTALVEALVANSGMIGFSELATAVFQAPSLKVVPVQVRQQICSLTYDPQFIATVPKVVFDEPSQTVAYLG